MFSGYLLWTTLSIVSRSMINIPNDTSTTTQV